MEQNEKKLIQLRVKLNFYKKLDKKIDEVRIGDLEVDDWGNQVYHKIKIMQTQLDDLKIEMNLSDEEYYQDEIKD